MPISGLVVQIDPARRDAILETLASFANLEVPETPAAEQLVVVVETPSLQEEEQLFLQLGEIPGVRNVTMSYHNFEDIIEPPNH